MNAPGFPGSWNTPFLALNEGESTENINKKTIFHTSQQSNMSWIELGVPIRAAGYSIEASV